MAKKKTKSGIFSKFIVCGVIALNVIFTAIVLKLFYVTGNEPAVLIGAWFGFTTVELWSLAGITKSKNRGEG